MPGDLHIFSGNDDFSIKENANQFIRTLCGPSPEEEPSLEIIPGDSDTLRFDELLDQLINSLTTPPFLTPRKIIWLKHFNKFEDALAEKSTKKTTSRLDHIAELFKQGIMDGITVVIDGPGLDRKRVFYKTCAAVCESGKSSLNWYEKLDPKNKNFSASMIRKAQEIAQEQQRKLSPDAASFLAETSGGDLLKLKSEITKLVTYAGDRNMITLDDCREVCPVTAEALSWEFSSALAERDAVRAVRLIPRIIASLEQGSSSGRVELAILGAVASEFRKLLTVKCEGERYSIPANASPGYFENLFSDLRAKGIKNSFVSLHPYRAFRMWGNAGSFSAEEMADIFDAVFEANRAVVTGSDPRRVLENLAFRIAGKKRSR